MHNIQIDIVSDIACPWCAIGYARLTQAMEQLAPEYNFSVQWRAFELDPDHSGEGEPILPALVRKYGSTEAEMRANQDQMIQIANALGVNFDKLQERFTCNTFDAHRLVKWAGEQGLQTQMKLALFDAYFGRADDVSNHDVLIQCAATVGLEATQARAVLNSDEYAQTVRDDEATYQQAGVSAVPAFIVNNKYLISGAQEADTLVQAFQDIAAEAE
ncbi:DsbA family oxidoreductase [Gilvimarinus agarilyticus]|uniref:DsbA family oxidoreductase n=1 Tax=Gilvimarinus agarilyticus TaxID=679259 RepID=UPI00059F54B0|nr:DsbA family oxidoreductase [Gilvimarinus agarilyticus]